jgi:hypothetical protein
MNLLSLLGLYQEAHCVEARRSVLTIGTLEFPERSIHNAGLAWAVIEILVSVVW